MDLLEALILALVQGLTEFLPISSSGHLSLLERLFGWETGILSFNVAVHLGTLIAVLAYFRAEVRRLLAAWLTSLRGGGLDQDGRLAWALLLATIPVGLAGLAFHSLAAALGRSIEAIAAATVGFGVLLGWASRRAAERRTERALGWGDALAIGAAQVLALIPGTSRSGITMTAGLMLGLTREAAARFSFLLAIPVILLAAGYEGAQLVMHPVPMDWTTLALGTGVAAVTAYLTIDLFLRLLQRIGFMPFVVYRVVLGVVLLALLR